MKKIYRTGVQKKIINGKAYVVKYENNKIVEKKRLTTGNSTFNSRGELSKINLDQARINAKANNSIFPDRQRERNSSWKVSRYSRDINVNYENNQPALSKFSPIKKPNKSYNYVIQGHAFRNKRQISIAASSDRYPAGSDINIARNQALDYFYKRVSFIAHGEQSGHYDADEGRKFIAAGKVVIDKEGVVWYTKN